MGSMTHRKIPNEVVMRNWGSMAKRNIAVCILGDANLSAIHAQWRGSLSLTSVRTTQSITLSRLLLFAVFLPYIIIALSNSVQAGNPVKLVPGNSKVDWKARRHSQALSMDNYQLCGKATRSFQGDAVWDVTFKIFVDEAIRRNLSLKKCAGLAGHSNNSYEKAAEQEQVQKRIEVERRRKAVADAARNAESLRNRIAQDEHNRQLTAAHKLAMAPLKKKNKHSVAVIIGNKDYKSRIPTVDFAHNDANAFRAFVIDVLGYDPENIIDLRDASKAQLETAFGNRETHEGKLWRYISPKGKSDVVVFYSGHGVPGLKDKRGYILPVNADAETPEINGFPVDTLLANLGKLKTKSMTVFLDACFSGDSQGGRLVRSTSGIAISPKLPSSSSSMTIITAAQGDQVASWDLKAKHGMFTKHLLDALRGEADKASYGNGDKKVSLGEVREYLDDRLTRAARRQFGRHQNAWARGDSSTVLASVMLAPRKIVRPIAIEEMDATYVAVKTANLRAAPSTNSKIVGSLSSGRNINVTGRVSGKNWFRLNDGSFVFGNLIKPGDAAELSYWSSIKDSNDADDFKGYMERFPNGQFVGIARRLVEALKPKRQKASIRVATRTAPTTQQTNLNEEEAVSWKQKGVLPQGTVRERYEFAYNLLRRLKMGQAEVALKEFLVAHPTDPLVDRARYWLGESYFSRRDYTPAARTFFEGYSKAPRGPKAIDNLYKLGKSLARMDQKDDACASYDELLNKFKGAKDQAIRQRAQIEHTRLGCR
jgi:tol-pal system protein YbgF